MWPRSPRRFRETRFTMSRTRLNTGKSHPPNPGTGLGPIKHTHADRGACRQHRLCSAVHCHQVAAQANPGWLFVRRTDLRGWPHRARADTEKWWPPAVASTSELRWICRSPRLRSRHLPSIRRFNPNGLGSAPSISVAAAPETAACVKPSPAPSASTRECHLLPKSLAGLQSGRLQAALYANLLAADAAAADCHTGLAKR